MGLELKHNIPKEITEFLDDMDRNSRMHVGLSIAEQRAVAVIKSIWPAMREMEEKLCRAQIKADNLSREPLSVLSVRVKKLEDAVGRMLLIPQWAPGGTATVPCEGNSTHFQDYYTEKR